MINIFTRWFNGKTQIEEFENDPNSSVWISPRIYTEYHWTAKVARVLTGFYLRNWQWVWGTAIALLALYVSILALK